MVGRTSATSRTRASGHQQSARPRGGAATSVPNSRRSPFLLLVFHNSFLLVDALYIAVRDACWVHMLCQPVVHNIPITLALVVQYPDAREVPWRLFRMGARGDR